MSLDLILKFLFWNMCVHIGVLLYWLIMFSFFKKVVYIIHSKLFSVSETEFNNTHYLLMGYYKLTVIIFIVIPFLVLKFLV